MIQQGDDVAAGSLEVRAIPSETMIPTSITFGEFWGIIMTRMEIIIMTRVLEYLLIDLKGARTRKLQSYRLLLVLLMFGCSRDTR